MSEDRDLRRPGGTILTPMRSIRKHCIECMGGSAEEVVRCTAPKCWLYPYRLGKHPKFEGRERSEAQKKADLARAERLRSKSPHAKSGLESTNADQVE